MNELPRGAFLGILRPAYLPAFFRQGAVPGAPGFFYKHALGSCHPRCPTMQCATAQTLSSGLLLALQLWYGIAGARAPRYVVPAPPPPCCKCWVHPGLVERCSPQHTGSWISLRIKRLVGVSWEGFVWTK